MKNILLSTICVVLATLCEAQERTQTVVLPADTLSAEVVAAQPLVVRSPKPVKRHFLPMHRRIDRGVQQGRFAYKGELMLGLTASYGTITSDETDFMVIIDNINLSGTMATVKPFIGYFYRDNRCLGVRFGYQHMNGKLGNVDLDLGEQNDISMNISGMELSSDSYSFGLFHRSYVGLDPKGRFGLFAEIEASVKTGTNDFVNGSSGDKPKATYSDNFKAELSFNPGMAVYIFPNVCATVSIGLGGIQYASVKQHDADGKEIGSRSSSKMRFRVNIIDINFGVVVHFWDKKKR
ncbi:MAG: hypothetical protein RR522_02600 [Alistipes sp.]